MDKIPFESIVQNAGDAIFVIGKTETIAYWNRGAEELLGYSQSDILGKSADILSPFEDKRFMRAITIQVIEEGVLKNLESELVKKDGRTISAYLTASRITDANENVIGVSIVAKDVTDQNRLLIHLIDQQRRAGQLEALVRSLTTISHYVRNAAAVISARAEISREIDSVESYQKLVDTCLHETRRIVAVVVSLNDMVKEVEKSGDSMDTVEMTGAPTLLFDIEARIQEHLKKI